jgi:hypothetical protein
MHVLFVLFRLVCAVVARRSVLVAENLALRQQLAVLLRDKPRPRLRLRDRLFWVVVSRWFSGWRSWLAIVKPATVIAWHRRGFRLFWRWKSGGGTPGRPTVPRAVIALIRRMARENVTWGAPRIRAELGLLGHDVASSTVAKYRPKGPSRRRRVGRPSSRTTPATRASSPRPSCRGSSCPGLPSRRLASCPCSSGDDAGAIVATVEPEATMKSRFQCATVAGE